MPKALKKKERRFTIQTLIRVAIFFVIIFFLISYISSTQIPNQKLNILGATTISDKLNDIYSYLPPESRKGLENINQSSQIKYLQQQLDILKKETQGFPQKQIIEIQKQIAKMIFENYIKNLDNQQ